MTSLAWRAPAAHAGSRAPFGLGVASGAATSNEPRAGGGAG